MTLLPHTFKRIRLNLARSPGHPAGSDRDGYEFVAPLDQNGHIDPKLWRQHRDHCRVRRFWEGQEDEVGRLVLAPSSREHARWVFDYGVGAIEEEEAGYRFASHAFVPGAYVSIRNDDGDMHTFRVAAVEQAT
jgi:hypothetical protein